MRKLTLDEIQQDAARRGGRCLAETYVDSLTLMDWECAEGHRWRAVAHSIRQGHWCKKCADERLRHSVAALHAAAAEPKGLAATRLALRAPAALLDRVEGSEPAVPDLAFPLELHLAIGVLLRQAPAAALGGDRVERVH